MHSRSKSAFTLIELLVVIAIIAILAAILFPVFAQAREKARQTTCTSNMKQIGLGLLMYCQDYDETFPSVTAHNYPAVPGIPTDAQTWVYNDILVLIQPYVKNYNVFLCPDRSQHVPASGDFCNPNAMTQYVWGYGYNWSSGYGPHDTSGNPHNLWDIGDGCVLSQTTPVPGGDSILPGRAIAGVNFPATFITLGDTGDTPRQTLHTAVYDTRCNPSSGWNADLPTGARHMGGNTFAFADGHAKWYHLNAELVDPYGVGVTTPAVVPNRYWFSATWDGVKQCTSAANCPVSP
jgi:prepilin-type N-terminal cleavage/methylation domain-containing protein/prepilin-type processing-associated H-X9-DG protein